MTPSYIDLILSKNITNLPDPILLNELSSDHLPLTIDWKIKVQNESGPTSWTFNNTNWRLFRDLLKNQTTINNNITDTQQLESEVTLLTENIQQARNKVGKKRPIIYKEDRLTDEIINLIKFKNKIRRRWQQTRHINDRLRYQEIQTNIRKKINDHKNTTWNSVLRELSAKDNSLWRLVKRLKNKYHNIPTLQNNNNDDVQTNNDKANLLASNWQQTYAGTPSSTQEQKQITDIAARTVHRQYPIPPTMWRKLYVKPKEVLKIIKSLPKNKAPGEDGISTILLKNLPTKTVVNITYIINAIIKLQHFPSQWKRSIVIPILKTGKNPKEAGSYRPISLLSHLSKIAEKAILGKLEKTIHLDGKYQEEQCGFRSGRSTVHMLSRVLHDTISKINNEQSTVALALDISNAFDAVWINGLLYKMIAIHNFPLYIIALFKTYLMNREFQVKVGNSLSRPIHIKCGVPQGAVLAPKLFNLYLTDIPTHNSTKIGLFADDILLYAHSYYANVAAAHIRNHLRKLLPWFDKWKLKLNQNKCEGIVMTRKFTNIVIHEPIKIHNTNVRITNQIKYLGVITDKRLRFHLHIRHVLNTAFAAMQGVYALLAPNSHLSQSNKILLYKQIIRPAMLYAVPIWCSVSDTQVKRLQVMQNKILRCVTGAGRYARIDDLHAMTNIPTIRDYMTEISDKFYRYKTPLLQLTNDVTNIRHYHEPKHKPLYARLPIYQEELQNV